MLKKLFLLITASTLLISCQNSETKKIGYKGDELMDKASISRDKDTKKATLNIQVEGDWKLYAGNTVETIDLSKAILEGDSKGEFPLDVDTAKRIYFQLETKNGTAILADKHLPMEGGYNFRDMGGIRTKDGKHVKWGKMFRSDEMHKLTEADLNYLSSIPMTTIVDFRTKDEVAKAADKEPASLKNRYELNISPGRLSAQSGIEGVSELLKTVGGDELMREVNKQFITDSTCRMQFKEFFRLAQSPEDTPIIFHCSAGKDRTGMAAALFLYALGVDEETIMNDYLLSNKYLKPKYEPLFESAPEMKPLFTVQRDYLQTGFDQIKKDYGSVDKYLTDELGVNIEKMRENYLD